MNCKKALTLVTTLLFLLTAVVCFVDDLPKEWMPKWEVGDWWIVKASTRFRQGPPHYGKWSKPWSWRYEVTGIEEVKGFQCYVLEMKYWPINERRSEERLVFYFRKENFRLIRETNYSYRLGELQPPVTIDYDYTVDAAFISPGLVNVPSFPLIFKGAKADSLSKPRWSPQGGFVTQKVSVGKIKDFKEELTDSEIKISFGENCYHVILEGGGRNETERRKGGVRRVEQIWDPDFAWFLYSEVGGRAPDGTKSIQGKTWLVDYFSLHK